MTAQDGRDGSFRAIVLKAITIEAGGLDRGAGEVVFAKAVATSILERLHERGLAIHDPANCVRRPWQDRTKDAAMPPIETVGREMTLDEMAAVGLVSDDVPD